MAKVKTKVTAKKTAEAKKPKKTAVERKACKIIKAVEKLLSSPKRWCRGTDAMDKHGQPVQATSKAAVRWCVNGAFLKVAPKPSDAREMAWNELGYVVDELSKGRYNDGIEFNDAKGRKHVAMKQLLAGTVKKIC